MKIGDTVPRHDALTKVAGAEKYAADYYGNGFLRAAVKRAGMPHGRIKGIDVAAAMKVPGVIAVLTSKDVKGKNRQGVVMHDQPILADGKIRYAGEPVALIVAETKEALRDAMEKVRVDAETLPGVFSPDDALLPGAPLVHETHPGANLLREVKVVKGMGEAGLDACDVVVEMSFETPWQEHAYLETEAGWAYRDDSGAIVIIASTQTPFRDCLEVADALGVDAANIRIIAPYLGGAFGGKDGLTVQALLALAVLHADGRPVKMWWEREESFLAGVKRLPAKMDYRLGAMADGMMHALGCRLVYDSGAHANLSGEIMTLGVEHAAGAYRIPHVSIEGCAVYTNNGLGGPFRGFGVPQVTAAIEQAVDMLADRLGMDRLELRIKNALVQGDENGIGVAMVRSTRVRECLEMLGAHALWRDREEWKASAGPFKRRGVGIACLSHAMGYPKIVPDRAGAKIELTIEGNIRVSTGVADMGQGNGSTYLQIAAHALGQDFSRMELVLPDTDRVLPCGSASASRCTYVFGNALLQAAGELKKIILAKAARVFEAPVEGLVLGPGCVVNRDTGEKISLDAIARACSDKERCAEAVYTAPIAAEDLSLVYMGPHLLFSYGAHIVRVEVDELTGEVEIKDYLATTDGGSVLNPQIFEQQIQGGIAQGIGYALTENFVIDRGMLVTRNLATYTIPTAVDIPDMVSLAVDTTEETGPYGMKGVGEIGINGPVPAIANAIADALGVRPSRAPLTAESVLGLIGKPTRQGGRP